MRVTKDAERPTYIEYYLNEYIISVIWSRNENLCGLFLTNSTNDIEEYEFNKDTFSTFDSWLSCMDNQINLRCVLPEKN